jgi:DNA-binding NtrC family response regulator
VTAAAPAEDEGKELKHLGDAMSKVVGILLDRRMELAEALAVFELCYARAAVTRQGGNLSQAAVDLGVHRNTLRAKLRRNGGPPSRVRTEKKTATP